MRLVLVSVLAAAVMVFDVVLGTQVVGAIAERQPATPAGEQTSLADLVPGDCVSDFSWREYVQDDYSVVSCEDPHGAELVEKIDGTEAFETYPGEAVATSFSSELCSTVENYAVNLRDDLRENYPNAAMRDVYPSAYHWGLGSPYFYCFLTNTDGKALIGGYYTDDTFQ